MPLPFKIGSPPTVDFSDYKNSFMAVYSAIDPLRNNVSDGSLALGHSYEYVDWRFDIDTVNSYPLLRAYIHADKVGSPTFNVSLNLYADDGSGNPDLNNKLSSGVTVPASAFPTTARLMLFAFVAPVANIVDATNYHPVFKASAQGDVSNHVRIYKDSGGTLTGANSSNAGTRPFGSSTWTYPGTPDIIRGALYREDNRSGEVPPSPPTLWTVVIDKTNNKIRIYKSLDGGATWSEISASVAPSCSTTSGLKSVSIQETQSSLYEPALVVASNTGTVDATFSTHRITPGIVSNDWGSESGGSLSFLNADVAGNTPRGFGRRVGSDKLIACQGNTETVMGQARRRVKMKQFYGSTILADVVGSANSPIAGTLPGTATHYDLRFALMDLEDRFHIFYSNSDDNNIQHRVLNADDTFSTINTIGSTPAVCSNTSAYPIGLGCNYYKNNEWRIAIMYLDSTSGTIKVAHCKAADSATASSWTIEQISTDTPEVTTSNLGFLSADSQQSGQLIAVYVKSDDTIWRTQDQGNGNWTAPVQVRSGQSVQGIAGYLTARNLNFMYLDTTPTPDELKFDRL